jgi:tRNA nucleotidyltransferase (CCA-adding enzyme)
MADEAPPGMHLIVTHEQADFDAVASLLGAHLLNPQAKPVLPRRLNRNVRAFLTLYGDQLPFLDTDDLARLPIRHVTLVDTQSLPSLRGLGKDTSVDVIDHHPPAEAIDPAWAVQQEDVGATTTLLLEAIQDADLAPDLVSATLLLLGIYEDTGSLSYASTTPRDARAAAWLLESGASLALADDFLNHPLSADQRTLYDSLLENAETHEFAGQSVVIACARAGGLVDEISSIAHKLRDLFDPAGLFVIVALNGSIQLVARSTDDSIDVSRVAEHFGGGGHSRAAAALIRGKTIEQVCGELQALLPGVVRPARTVGEIMSLAPQLLSPATTVADAARRMQRFGHEGYPVIRDGGVIGLLTRRAVDRAMAHGMGDRPVTQVMDAGSLVVHPADSVQHLQRVMIRQDWGQVPVADPESGKIIGIVTRTDLLRILAAPGGDRGAAAWTHKLESALSPARLALLRLVARSAEERQAALYLVGGFVRDLMLGQPSVDFDLVVEGDAIGLAESLARTHGGRVSSHARFGTAKWRLDPSDPRLASALGCPLADLPGLPASLDLVAARTEFYAHPTALPSVQRGSIKLDLHRRDFTINTLALRLDGVHFGQLLDPWGGGRDLQQRKIRVLHSISFVDDPTRLLRAARLEQRLGFEIEPRTLELMHQALPLLDRVSGERIRNELELVFGEARSPAILRRLHDLGLLAAIASGLVWDAWLEERFGEASGLRLPQAWQLELHRGPEALLYALWLLRTMPDEADRIAERLRFPQWMRRAVRHAQTAGSHPALHDPASRPSQIVDALEGAAPEALVAAWLGAPADSTARRAIDSYLSTWRRTAPQMTGEDLRRIGVPPGPLYRQVLTRLREARLDGLVSTREDEERFLHRALEEASRRG